MFWYDVRHVSTLFHSHLIVRYICQTNFFRITFIHLLNSILSLSFVVYEVTSSSALIQYIVNGILYLCFQAQTYAAEAAGVMAENAKTFVAEKMEKVRANSS